MAVNPVAPFKLTIYNRHFVRVGLLSDPVGVKVIPRHNLKGMASFTVSLDNAKLPLLMESGSRMVIDYMGKQVLSGPITARTLTGPAVSGVAQFEVEDDFRVLNDVLAWPVPNYPITDQTPRTAHVLTGRLETVVLDLIRANLTNRLNPNIIVSGSASRGPVVTIEARMVSLFDAVIGKLNEAGLALTVKQLNGTLIVGIHQPGTFPLVLTEESGIVQSWTWSNKAPTATRAIVGGAGEDNLRDFRLFTDPTAEADWGIRSEVFVSASDTGTDYMKLLSDLENAKEKAERERLENDKAQTEAWQSNRDASHSEVSLQNAQATGDSAAISRAQSELVADRNTVTSRSERAQDALYAYNVALTERNVLAAQVPAAKAEYEALMAARGAESLVSTSEKVGLRLTLSETDSFRYGEVVNVGDMVTMKVGPGLTITDRLLEATLSWTFEAGVSAEPAVGEMTDNPDRAFAKALRNSATKIRKIEVK